jgi:crotonobetainyl-CoA:carnitine CoA-transferase CaiB-like acyl-CoA transferase
LGKVANRTGDEHPLVPWQLFPCRDGQVAIIGGPIRRWLGGAKIFEEPQLLAPKYAHVGGRMEHREEVNELMGSWLRRNDKGTIYQRGQAVGMAFGYLASLAEVHRLPQLQARDFFKPIEHPTAGCLEYCGPPFRPAETPWSAARAPVLGEHNRDVFQKRLGRSPNEIEDLKDRGVI